MTSKSLSDLLGNSLLKWTLVIGINAVGIASVVGIPVALLFGTVVVATGYGYRWLIRSTFWLN